jgi:hypothetical protein
MGRLLGFGEKGWDEFDVSRVTVIRESLAEALSW